MSLSSRTIPQPKNWQDFEHYTWLLFKAELSDPRTQMHGRTGQAQNGVDVYGRRNKNDWVGIQCKLKYADFVSEVELKAEVEKAKLFIPKISEFILVTTTRRDANIQKVARQLTEDLSGSEHEFSVDVWGWDQFEERASHHDQVWKHLDPTFDPFSERGFKGINSRLDKINIEPALPHIDLVLDENLSIKMDDHELLLFCSETARKLKKNLALISVIEPKEQTLLQEAVKIDALEAPTDEQRLHRSNLENQLEYVGKRLRQLEASVQILLTDSQVQSPWLIGGDWINTAVVLRRMVKEVLSPMQEAKPGGVTLKIRSPHSKKIVTWINLNGEDEADFLNLNPHYTPRYFLGNVCDLGDKLGIKYALPAGIAALMRYSAGFDVPIEALHKNGDMMIYTWSVEAA